MALQVGHSYLEHVVFGEKIALAEALSLYDTAFIHLIF